MPRADFQDAVSRELGVQVDVTRTGEIQRFPTNGKRGDKAGWLVFFETAGAYGDWRTGATYTWSEKAAPLSHAERLALQQKIDAAKRRAAQDREERSQQARHQAWTIWQQAKPAASHAYLEAKHVQAHGIRQHAGRLIIPLVDEAGGLWSLQTIDANDNKLFLPGGKTRGRFHLIQGDQQVGIAEGYATGASIRERHGHTMFVAFNAGNLEAVAVTARAMYPDAPMTIWADNDQWTPGNPGLTKAREAARAAFATVRYPDFSGYDLSAKPTDWNDYYRTR